MLTTTPVHEALSGVYFQASNSAHNSFRNSKADTPSGKGPDSLLSIKYLGGRAGAER